MNQLPQIAGHVPCVLLVDDETQNRTLLELMLAPEGFRMLHAASGEDALAIVAKTPPDLVLMDIMMPGMDGYEVTARLKAEPATKGIPVIMVTALEDRQSRMVGLSAGAEDFLSKPVDRAELCVRVRNLLRLKAYADYHDKYSLLLEEEVTARTSELLESETRFRQVAETIHEVFFLVDPQMTQVFYISPAYEDIFGQSCASLYANPRSWASFVHPQDFERVRDEVMPNGTMVPFDVEHRVVRPDGTERSVRSRGFPVYGPSGVVYRFAGISEDITERRTLEAQVRQTNKMDAIGRLSSGVAHDFNNLLTVILGFTEFVAADKALGPKHVTDLGEVIKAARRAAGLTKQLLAFGRQQVMHTASFDLNALITDMTGMLRRLIGEHLDIELALSPTLSMALGDRGHLEQVVMNLVVNARDAMPEGGRITIETKDVSLENSIFHDEVVVPGRYVMLAVTDTGMGMSKETQRRLFEPFFTTKEVGKGTGLGLSTTYGIVKQSKGHIWVYSELGQGTTFKVYLPKSTGDQSQIFASMVVEPIRSGSETVLLVEDEAAVRRLAKQILDGAGYRVLEAANGNDAEVLFSQHADTIDLVVTDVVMPGCGGPELLSRLHSDTPDLKVLYMSGYTSQSSVIRAGIEPHLLVQKPFTAAQLVQQVRDVLDRR